MVRPEKFWNGKKCANRKSQSILSESRMKLIAEYNTIKNRIKPDEQLTKTRRTAQERFYREVVCWSLNFLMKTERPYKKQLRGNGWMELQKEYTEGVEEWETWELTRLKFVSHLLGFCVWKIKLWEGSKSTNVENKNLMKWTFIRMIWNMLSRKFSSEEQKVAIK